MQPTSAHLKTLREATGLSITRAAKATNTTDTQWRQWEDPDNTHPIPPHAVEYLHTMLLNLYDDVEELTGELMDALDAGEISEGTPVPLIRYRSQAAFDAAYPAHPYGITFYDRMLQQAVADLIGLRLDPQVYWHDQPNPLNSQP